ncbi:MAG: NADH dehydrogenase subunit [Euryarchaeota archaeon]|nr:NADH dehydrogenase subunit [Euryarchaeota archaeon]
MNDDPTFIIPVGPVHPALKEPIQLVLTVDGERIVGVDVKCSQVHRGIEWLGMNRNNPIQSIYLSERVCGICNVCHPYCMVMAVEEAAGIEVPERADYIRTIVAELERIHSHLLWAGVAAHEIGFDTVFHYTWALREEIMDTIEYVTGNRVTKAIMMIGGVRRDITTERAERIKKATAYYLENFQKIADIFLHDKSIKMRTRNVGILTKEDALKLCAVGPVARASGVPKDVRQDAPYGAYAELDMKAITPDMYNGEIVGDVYDRIIVRLLEVKQSVELINAALDNMPSGEIVAEKNLVKLLAMLKRADGEGIGRVEAPRGEDIHYVRLEKGKEPFMSWKIRAPTYNNVLPWIPMLLGGEIADVPIVAASTDPCMSCLNRVTVVDESRNREFALTKEMMHEMSIRKTRRLMRND